MTADVAAAGIVDGRDVAAGGFAVTLPLAPQNVVVPMLSVVTNEKPLLLAVHICRSTELMMRLNCMMHPM
jgi:hypothetical protein